MRRYLAVAFALCALLMLMPQPAVAAPTENDAGTVLVQDQPAQVAQAVLIDAVQVMAEATLRGEPSATASHRPRALFTGTAAPFTNQAQGYVDTQGRLPGDERSTLRAAMGRNAVGIH